MEEKDKAIRTRDLNKLLFPSSSREETDKDLEEVEEQSMKDEIKEFSTTILPYVNINKFVDGYYEPDNNPYYSKIYYLNSRHGIKCRYELCASAKDKKYIIFLTIMNKIVFKEIKAQLELDGQIYKTEDITTKSESNDNQNYVFKTEYIEKTIYDYEYSFKLTINLIIIPCKQVPIL